MSKIELYNKATNELIMLAHDYDLPVIGKFSFPEIVHLLRESFKYPTTHKQVFGFPAMAFHQPSENFCAIASYFIYNNTGRDKQWKIMKGKDHWWLEHKIISGQFDVTYDQFPKLYDYRSGRLETDKSRMEQMRHQSLILGRCAGME